MKLQIDTNEMTIMLEEPTNAKELFKMLKKLFPDNAWERFTIEMGVEPAQVERIIIRERDAYKPHWPWYVVDDTSRWLAKGNYNVEYKSNTN